MRVPRFERCRSSRGKQLFADDAFHFKRARRPRQKCHQIFIKINQLKESNGSDKLQTNAHKLWASVRGSSDASRTDCHAQRQRNNQTNKRGCLSAWWPLRRPPRALQGGGDALILNLGPGARPPSSPSHRRPGSVPGTIS